VLDAEGGAAGDATAVGRFFGAALGAPRDWVDRGAAGAPAPNYDVVKLYTSEIGYRAIFAIVNRIFRTMAHDGFAASADAGAFLVELLNIDLFNYWHVVLGRADFHGTVYRGMCVSEQDLAIYRSLLAGSIQQRAIGIPLGMVSTSLNPGVPRQFMHDELNRDASLRPFLWRIHTFSLEQGLVAVYQQRYPTSVISSICALPICRISDYPGEEEVLLRGPFFQMLGMIDASPDFEPIEGKPVTVIDVALMTANRDHHSTLALGAEDAHARALFNALVQKSKHAFCAAFHAGRGEPAQAAHYDAAHDAARAKLQALGVAS